MLTCNNMMETDITKTGAQNFSELQEQNYEQFKQAYSNQIGNVISPIHKEYGKYFTPIETDYTEQGLEAGFGDSKFDKSLSNFRDLNQLNNIRGQQQNWAEQLSAGILKGGILATTTFADGIAGTFTGLGNIISQSNQNNLNSGSDVLNAFIDNPFSNLMNDINNWSEQALPNYYTEAEQNDPWYQHIFSANFIGDKFLKNFGFMIGAAYSGRVNAGLLSKAMGMSELRNAFKGAVVTAKGETLTNAADILKAYQTGDAYMDGVRLTQDLAKQAKKLKNSERLLKSVGSLSAAAGEARIEALSNSSDHYDLDLQYLDDDYKKSMESISYALQREHPEWFGLVKNPDSNSWDMTLLAPEGYAELERRQEQLTNKYNQAKTLLEQEKASMANEIFLANVAFLTLDNSLTLGRFYAGGYNTGRKFKNLIKKDATGYVADNTAINLTRANALKTPFVEANEEMGQAFISETAGLKAGEALNSFWGKKVDPESTEEITDWYNTIRQGWNNTYGNFDRWEEGFIGGITGLLGMPSFTFKENAQGKKTPSVSMSGEMWEGLRDAQQMKQDQQNFLTKLNSALQNPEFTSKFQAAIRDNAIQKQKNQALTKGDRFSYKNAELEELVNAAILFDQAGAMDELYDKIDEMSNLELKDVADIRQATIDKETQKSLYDGMSDEEVLEAVKNQASQIKKQLDTYVKISDDLKTLYGNDIDTDTLTEITATLCSVSDFEERFKEIFEKVKTGLGNQLLVRDSKYFEKNESKKLNIELASITNAQELLEFRDTQEVIQALEANLDWMIKNKVSTKEIADQINDWKDLIKIYKARNAFINKYNMLSQHPELFTEQNLKDSERIMKDFDDKVADTAIEGIKEAKTISELRDLLPDDKIFANKVLERIKQSDDDNLKQLVKNYEDYQSKLDSLTSSLDNVTDQDVVNAVETAINNNPENMDDAIAELQDAASSLPEDKAKILNDVINSYLAATTSKKSAKTKGKAPKQSEAKNADSPTKSESKKEKMSAALGLEDDEEDDDIDDEDIIDDLTQDDDDDTSIESQEDAVEAIDQAQTEDDLDDAIQDIQQAVKEDILSKKEGEQLIKLANKKAESIKGSVNIQDDVEDEEGNSDKGVEKPNGYVQKLRSWIVTKFDLNSAKKRILSLYKDEKEQINNVIDSLDSLGAFDFVDEGYLGRLFQKNPKLKIHFIVAKKGNLKGEVLTAVAVNKEDVTGKNAKASKAIKIGNKYYQVVGALGAPESNLSYLSDLKAAIKDDIEDSEDDYEKSTITSYIKHIYSGRMVTSSDSQEKVSKPITKDYISSTSKIAVMQANQKWRVPGVDKMDIVPLNTNNSNPREGSVWLLTQEADGRWYAKYLKPITFTEYDIEEHQDSELIQDLFDAIKILADTTKNPIERLDAKILLKDILYFPEGVDIFFGDSSVTINNNGAISTVQLDKDSLDDTTSNIITKLQDSKLNLRFNINGHQLQTNASMQMRLAEAGIFESDLLLHNNSLATNSVHNINGSFDIAEIDLDTLMPEEDDEDIQVGHTGRKGIDTSKTSTTVFLKSSKGGKTFVKDNNDVWHYNSVDGDVITNWFDKTTAKKLEQFNQMSSGLNGTNIFNFKFEDKDYYVIKTKSGGFTFLNDEVAEKILKKDADKSEQKSKAKKAHQAVKDLEEEGIPMVTIYSAEDEETDGDIGEVESQDIDDLDEDDFDGIPMKTVYSAQLDEQIEEEETPKEEAPKVNTKAATTADQRRAARRAALSKTSLTDAQIKDTLSELSDTDPDTLLNNMKSKGINISFKTREDVKAALDEYNCRL